MKKILEKSIITKITFLLLILLSAKCFAAEVPEGFKEYELSNGMEIFVLEDFSTPNVRVEYTARAGSSKQDSDNTGFFVLYSKLFSNAGKYSYDKNAQWRLDSITSECNADSARYYLTTTSFELPEIMDQISRCAFAPIFQDKELNQSFSETQKEITENAFSIEGFINSSIDSRIFSKAPWKHDSGIYPSLFQKITQPELRAKLSDIAKRFYTPQNSALFISGGINAETAIALAEKNFGRFLPSKTFSEEPDPGISKDASQKNFVLTDPEFSPEMTQLVIQYTNLSMNQCDIASAILNQRNSMLKTKLMENKTLGILAADYINIDSSHKNSSSRMIIQSLLENSKLNPFQQTEEFRKILLSEISDFSRDEFEGAKFFLANQFRISLSDSTSFMSLLSQFWAVDGTPRKELENSGSKGDASSLVLRFVNHDLEILNEDYEETKFAIENETPWIFTFVNSENLKSVQKSFSKNGYEIVTTKNGSWYTQKLFQNLQNKANETEENPVVSETKLYNERFFEDGTKRLSFSTLSNGIEIITENKTKGERSAISLYISKGEIDSPKKRYGLESVIIGELSQNLRKNAMLYYSEGRFSAMPEINYETGSVDSIITLECFNEEILEGLQCIYESLIFAEVNPADIDGLIYNEKSGHIIKTGSTVYQLFSFGIKKLYPKSSYEQLFNNDSAILKNVKFEEVLELFPELLNASNIKILASGNFHNQEFLEHAENLFSNLLYKEVQPFTTLQCSTVKETYRIKLQHLFLTDVTKEKAGPRPQVLIPTTDFSDPVQFWIKAPESDEATSIVFDELLLSMKKIMEEEIAINKEYDGISIQIKEKDNLIPFRIITFINVKYTSIIDELYEKALSVLNENLHDENFLNNMKALWIKENFSDAEKNYRTIQLIRNELTEEKISSMRNENLYFDDYRIASETSAGKALEVFKKYFSENVFLKLYSADSKK